MKIAIEERVEQARELFKQGYNCAQAVAVAYADVLNIDERQVAILSAPFGGGLGRLREVCGAVSGMSLLAGTLAPSADPTDKASKQRTYALVQNFAEQFRKENGAIVCRELLGLTVQKEDPTPSDRTEAYYKKRPCVDLVECAARIVGEYIATREASEL
jgi:C_GCAxxG_C_C family probable redox protein